MEGAKRLLIEHLKNCHRIAVAVSGGQDSMALLHLVLEVKNEPQNGLNFEVLVVNIDHNLRKKNSKKDSEFVRSFCEQNSIEFLGYSIDVQEIMRLNGLGAEQAGRKARFDTFSRLKNSAVAERLLLAHHALDQAETVLQNLLFGCGIYGASAMKILRDNYYFRPLLNTKKQAIIDYCAQNNIDFVEDETNKENRFNRNFLRNQIFPKLNERWDAEGKLCEFALRADADEQLIRSLSSQPQIDDGVVRLAIEELNAPIAQSMRYIKKGLELLGVYSDIFEINYEDIVSLKDKQSGKQIMLQNGLRAYREYDCVALEFARQPLNLVLSFEGEGEYRLGDTVVRVERVDKADFLEGALFIDGDRLPKDCVFRFRKDGDIFSKFGSGGKKLKQYFIDKKIPHRLRSSVVLLADDNEAFVVVGHEISNKVKIDSATKSILRFTII